MGGNLHPLFRGSALQSGRRSAAEGLFSQRTCQPAQNWHAYTPQRSLNNLELQSRHTSLLNVNAHSTFFRRPVTAEEQSKQHRPPIAASVWSKYKYLENSDYGQKQPLSFDWRWQQQAEIPRHRLRRRKARTITASCRMTRSRHGIKTTIASAMGTAPS